MVLQESLYCRRDYNMCNVIGTNRDQNNVTSTEASGYRSALGKSKTILIADNSEIVRTKIRQTLERDTPFEVCAEAADGIDAVSKVKELSPDLIILDVRMPGLNGVEVAGIVRYALPKTRIVLVTMYAEDLRKHFMSLFRIDAVLAKADGLTDLAACVTRLLTDRHLDIVIRRDCEVRLAVQQKPKQPGSQWSRCQRPYY